MKDATSLVPGDLPSNAPGQHAIAFRSGVYGRYKDGLLREIGREGRYLRDLNTRDATDPSIALVDAWAMVGEVLSFYSERIANEAYLRTATERRSVRLLARLVGYELRPGKAAEAWLKFTLENAPGAPAKVTIPVRTKVNSSPGPGETMVAFETTEEIIAGADLSAMRPQMERPQSLDTIADTGIARCAGVLNAARRGDWLILNRNTKQQLFRIERIELRPSESVTEIAVAPSAIRSTVYPMSYVDVPPVSKPILMGTRVTQQFMQSQVVGRIRDQRSFEAELQTAGINVVEFKANLAAQRVPSSRQTAGDGLFRFRNQAAIFGHNAAPPRGSAPTMQKALSSDKRLTLDTEYPELRPQSWIGLVTPELRFIARIINVDTVTAVDPISSSEYRMSARASEVVLDRALPSGWNTVSTRQVTVLIDSEPLALAPLPVTEDVVGSSLLLDDFYPGLTEGRPVAVEGERSDLPGVRTTEFHAIDRITIEDGFTRIGLKSAIIGPFRRETLAINANVARASHGETGSQPLGHGDASVAGQRFRLPIVPLTYLSAQNSHGISAALEIWVEGIRWREVASFAEAGPLDRVYVLRQEEDGGTVVQFGTGITGARLPTGSNNVVAVWRKGSGLAGMVKSGQLSLPAGVPQGVKAVVNPLRATGGAESESLEEARAGAPLSVVTLGRVVTLRDYADFARSFAGIAKAYAIWAYTGLGRSIFLTVAGAGGEMLEEGGRDLENLRSALLRSSDRNVRIVVGSYRPAFSGSKRACGSLLIM